MALGERLKKSLNRGKTFGSGKSGKFESNGNDSYRVRSEIEETKSLFTEKKFAKKGRDSDVKIFGRKPTNGRQRDFDREEPDEETRNRRAIHDWRAHRPRRKAHGGENIPVRSEVIDQLRSRGRNMGRKQRDVNGNGSKEMMRCPAFHDLRGTRGRKTDDSCSGRVYGRSEEMDGSADSDEDTRSRGANTEMRGHRGVKDGHKLRDTCGRKRDDIQGGRLLLFEAKKWMEVLILLKWKRMDKKRKDTDEDHSGDSLAEKDAPVRKKKKKRVMKIDPYDISNKRLDDSPPGGERACVHKRWSREGVFLLTPNGV